MTFRTLLSAVALALPGALPTHAADAPPPLPPFRVMTWNIHHGVGMDGKIDLPRIATYIRERQPDFVMLQEVDRNCHRTNKVDQPAEIGRLTEMHVLFAKAMDFDGGEYGIVILSRFEPGEAKTTPLPRGDEPRTLLTVPINTPSGSVLLACTHLDAADPVRRLAQAQIVSSTLLASTLPVILAGDFNSTPTTPVLQVFNQAPWTPVPKQAPVETSPSVHPVEEIDHVILRGLRSTENAAVLPETTASDHRPVTVSVARPK